MKKNNLKGSAILVLTSVIWGLAFVAQSEAADNIKPFAFNCLRSIVGAAFLAIVLFIKCKKSNEGFWCATPKAAKSTLVGGVICGIMLTLSVNLQQIGLTLYSKAGVPGSARGGFVTALYVIIVPILSIAFGKKVHPIIWPAVLIALFGTYLLCASDTKGGICTGDILVLCCAFAFSFHIMTVDKYGDKVGGIRLSMMQFIICAAVSAVLSLLFEKNGFVLKDIMSALFPILYLGIMSSGIAYTLQIAGQHYAEPAVASLAMSLESVFAALGGWIIVGDKLSPAEISGCALVFAAIVIAQIPGIIKSKSNKEIRRQKA